MTTIKIFTFNALYENTYVLSDETNEAVIIDAGCYTKEEEEQLKNYINTNNLKVVALLSTHSHVDHVLGNAFVKKHFNTKLYVHKIDADTLRGVKVYAPIYGFINYQESEQDGYLEEGSIFKFGNTSLKILFVPGHAPGHIAFYNEEEFYIIGGDVLFQNSIGRTDLPGGNFETLIKSIKTQFFTLKNEVKVYPGHGPFTTIGNEKKLNPFLN